ncbi:class I SAM-dependent methyltransferase [Leucobacter sp. UT-8R-CII-1-4]|uniref:class I SAM-dependent methyltransferase n=1 Tax=Leucobacter sp. UT-8R-CII-1-4 TaxID=3040075 RepID=UPI0024A8F64E|nr:class I SAM-dependent methyltransferase [Leucobacter sp. UT-8R-CII-1-4]MDI6023702.1 class I SAM-dependent methyltransferase [Leucobacter sp. UT-8R-CII-1-4]
MHQHNTNHNNGARPSAAYPDSGSPEEFWEQRYAGSSPIWSGKVNATLASAVAELVPGRSLDLGSGEGADVLWLAERGWQARGIELSPTAVNRARAAVTAKSSDQASFEVRNLAEWASAGLQDDCEQEAFELITASFFQSPVELLRAEILRAALARLTPGGRLVLVSHAAPPPWANSQQGQLDPGHDHSAQRKGPTFYSPADELAQLGLASATAEPQHTAEYVVEVAEIRQRQVKDPEGAAALIDDSLVVVRRR